MQNFDPDYYDVLLVSRDAKLDEIKSAFRKLAMKYHPDKKIEGQDEFVRIRTAYETLADSDLREKYNRYLDLLAGNNSLIEIRPVLQDLYDDMVNYIKTIAGFGAVVEYELILKRSYEEIDKIVRVTIPVESFCKKCFGTGGTIFKECPVCDGKQKQVRDHSYDIYVPAGSSDGEKMKLTFPEQTIKLVLRFR
jgi:molecular chaperone DnaJ